MKKFSVLILFALFLSSVSFASTKDVFDKIVAGDSYFGNGGAFVNSYDVKNFTTDKGVYEIIKTWHSSYGWGCGKPTITIGRTDNLDLIASEPIEDDFTATELSNLQKKNELKTIISASWNGSDGEVEYCTGYLVSVYSNDGYSLWLDYNFTD